MLTAKLMNVCILRHINLRTGKKKRLAIHVPAPTRSSPYAANCAPPHPRNVPFCLLQGFFALNSPQLMQEERRQQTDKSTLQYSAETAQSACILMNMLIHKRNGLGLQKATLHCLLFSSPLPRYHTIQSTRQFSPTTAPPTAEWRTYNCKPRYTEPRKTVCASRTLMGLKSHKLTQILERPDDMVS